MDAFAALPCVFCRRMVYTRASFDANGFARCPACSQFSLYTAEPISRVVLSPTTKPRLAPAILATFAQRVFGISVSDLASRYGMDVIGGEEGCLIAVWLDDVTLTTRAAAQILGTSNDWTIRLAAQGRFPGAFRGAAADQRYKRGPWQIPLGDVHAMLVEASEQGKRDAALPRPAAGTALDALVNALMRAEAALRIRSAGRLTYPAPVLDLLIIAQERARQTPGLTSDSVFRLPELRCERRAYLLNAQGEPIASFLGDELLSGTMSTLRAAALRIAAALDPTALRRSEYELWMLEDGRATRVALPEPFSQHFSSDRRRSRGT